jgi:glucokinase
MRSVILAVDAGGQSFKYALLAMDSLEALIQPEYIPVKSEGTREELLEVWHKVIRRAMSSALALGLKVAAMACSCPGPFDYIQGISLMTHKWAAIKGISLPDDFHGHGLPASVPVFFCHDGNSLILGEVVKGGAKGYGRVGGYIIGTGIGFGAYCDGKLVVDQRGCPVFGMYRRPYLNETVEDFASSRGVPRLYRDISGTDKTFTAKEIGDMAENGDPLAIRTYQEMGAIIARVSEPIIREYRFDCLVFGGRISNSFSIFAPAFSDELEKAGAATPHLVKSKGGELLSMTGASFYAKGRIER